MSTVLQPQSHRPHLRPPQFGLRTLLWGVTGCAVLLAATRWLNLSPLLLAGLAFLAVSIVLHVAGNAIGIRLRQVGDHPLTRQANAAADAAALGSHRGLTPEDFAPATRLSVRQSLGWTIIVATAAGVLLGAAGGGVWTVVSQRGPFDPFSMVGGIVAFGSLGGLAAFGIAALTQVLATAAWQALQTSSDRQPTRNGDP